MFPALFIKSWTLCREDRDRTCDLMLPKHALYRLSYFPKLAPLVGFEPTSYFQLPLAPFVAERDTGALNGGGSRNRTGVRVAYETPGDPTLSPQLVTAYAVMYGADRENRTLDPWVEARYVTSTPYPQTWWAPVVTLHSPKDEFYRLAAETTGFRNPKMVHLEGLEPPTSWT